MATESHSLMELMQRCTRYINHSIQDVKKSYSGYVAKNPEMIAQMEKTLKAISYIIEYIPRDYDNFVFVSELLNSANSLFTYVNDCILKGTAKFQLGENDPIQIVKLIERWIAIVEFTQAFVEMTAHRLGGRGARWAIVVLISLIKSAMRLVLLHGFKPHIQSHPIAKFLDRATLSQNPGDVTCNQPGKKSKPFVYVGRRTGHVMRTLDSTPVKDEKAIWEMSNSQAALGLDGKAVGSSFPTPPGSPTQLNKTERIGETLHILRPLIHLIGVGFFGDQSSIPWLAALVTDASSHTLLSGHVRGKLKTSLRFNSEERQELRRRALIIAFYLLRSPIYDRFTKTKILKVIQALCDHVPLARYVLEPVARYLPAWQQVYFYVWKE